MAVDINRLHLLLGGWREGRRSLYRELADAMADAIRGGSLLAGDVLPPERDLAAALAVSRSTVISAYDHLEREGLLRRRSRSRTEVAGRTADDVATGLAAPLSVLQRQAAAGTIALTGYLPVPADEMGAISLPWREIIEKSSATDTSRGTPMLRGAVAEHLTAYGLPTTADQILITSGMHRGFSLVTSIRTSDAPIAVETPTSVTTIDVLRSVRGRVVPLAGAGAALTADDVRNAALVQRARTIILTPVVHHPSGQSVPVTELAKINELAEERSLTIVHNCAFIDVALHDHQSPDLSVLSDTRANTILVGSFARLFGEWLAVGWMRASPDDVARLERSKSVTADGTSVVAQATALALLERIDHLQVHWRARHRALLDHAERRLREWLPTWSWEAPEGGAYLWLKLPHGEAATVVAGARRHGVLIYPGTLFTTDDSAHDHVALCFSTTEENLDEGLRRLAAAWTDMHAS